MAIELITGGNGTLHVQSADDGSIWGGVVGQGCYVLQGGDGVSCTMATANEAQVGTGVGVIYGRMWRIPTTTSVSIDSGTQAQRRHDLVCVHYKVTASDTVQGGVESAELVVLKGTPTSEAEADDPEIPGGDILEGATDAYMPLWRIPLDGISVGSPEKVFETVAPLSNTSRFRRLWSGSVRNPEHPITIPAPGIGDYSLVLMRGSGMNVLLLRDVGSDPQGGAIRTGTGNYACSVTVTEWAQDSITITEYIYSSHSNPKLGGTVTRNAGDWMTITGIWGIA